MRFPKLVVIFATILATLVVASPANAAKAAPVTPGQKVLNAALSHLGQGPSIVMTPAQIAAGEAWCSEFGSLVYTEAGRANLFTLGTPGTAVNTSTNKWYAWASTNARMRWSDPVLKADPTAANSLLSANVAVAPGDIVLEWHWKSSTGAWSTHTAIVESVTVVNGRKVFNTVDGNWGGIVVRRTVDTDLKGKIFAVIAPSNV